MQIVCLESWGGASEVSVVIAKQASASEIGDRTPCHQFGRSVGFLLWLFLSGLCDSCLSAHILSPFPMRLILDLDSYADVPSTLGSRSDALSATAQA
jgi:hypothetical protein